MQITLYTRPQCKTCNDTKSFLKTKNIDYTEVIIDKDVARDDVLTKAPNAKMLPVVFLDDIYIGSKEEIIRYVNKLEEIQNE